MMISVTDAKKIIEEFSFTVATVELPLKETTGLILAEDYYAGIDLPPFPQSSMDGYAFSFEEWEKGKRLKLTGEIAAGSNQLIKILPGEAMRIFTGAAVPQGADTVLMQEKSVLENKELVVGDDNLKTGENVRLRGAEIKKGSLALSKNTLLTPGAIGYLAGMGCNEVFVHPKPVVSIIVTGNELQSPGIPLQYGQVYEANSFSLNAALEGIGIRESKIYYCADILEMLTGMLENALIESDIVLLTGGVSVGDYDFTVKAAEKCGVDRLFHRIKQKPGKPVYFGKKDSKVVFGLPGNPASVLTCFYIYVVPVIEKMLGKKGIQKTQIAVSASEIKKPAGITWFLKGDVEAGIVTALDAQESYRLSSFARANCLIELGEDLAACKTGDTVNIHLLPV
jgi:molybdopterin molybdotransferase